MIAMTFESEQAKEEHYAMLQERKREKSAKELAYVQEHCRQDMPEDWAWKSMASALGVRLPPYNKIATPSVVRKFIRKLGKDASWLYDCWGYTSINLIIDRNKELTARHLCGIILEDAYYEIYSK